MDLKSNVQQIIDQLALEPHPEGGYFRETYRSGEMIKRGSEDLRNAGTGIYFLLPATVCTNWHRVSSDELWHFYKGDKLILETITTDGEYDQLLLGSNLSAGSLQELVPANYWQRAYSTSDYSLVGCTVAPGFEFDDFEMIGQEELAERFPALSSEIMYSPFSSE